MGLDHKRMPHGWRLTGGTKVIGADLAPPVAVQLRSSVCATRHPVSGQPRWSHTSQHSKRRCRSAGLGIPRHQASPAHCAAPDRAWSAKARAGWTELLGQGATNVSRCRARTIRLLWPSPRAAPGRWYRSADKGQPDGCLLMSNHSTQRCERRECDGHDQPFLQQHRATSSVCRIPAGISPAAPCAWHPLILGNDGRDGPAGRRINR